MRGWPNQCQTKAAQSGRAEGECSYRLSVPNGWTNPFPSQRRGKQSKIFINCPFADPFVEYCQKLAGSGRSTRVANQQRQAADGLQRRPALSRVPANACKHGALHQIKMPPPPGQRPSWAVREIKSGRTTHNSQVTDDLALAMAPPPQRTQGP